MITMWRNSLLKKNWTIYLTGFAALLAVQMLPTGQSTAATSTNSGSGVVALNSNALSSGVLKETAKDLPTTQTSTGRALNNVIINGNYTMPKITIESHSVFPKNDYSTSTGKPNGVVVHWTANENNFSARREADYMVSMIDKNYVFVHTFIDSSMILNIAPTDYLCWGAGGVGNARFAQFEMVTANTEADFIKTTSYSAWYTAYLLHQYGLKPSLARVSGNSGTIWGHGDITNMLGGTNHSDPDEYLSRWGYSMPDFLALVEYYYGYDFAQQEKYETTGTINAQNNEYVYDYGPNGTYKSRYNSRLSSYNGKTVTIDQRLITKDGKTWYRYSTDGTNFFYALASGFKNDDALIRNIVSNKSVSLAGTVSAANAASGIYDIGPANTTGSRYNSKLQGYNGKSAQIDQSLTLDNGDVWYHYSTNGKYWFYAKSTDFAGVKDADSDDKPATANVTIKKTDKFSATMRIKAVSGDNAYDYAPAGVAKAHKNAALTAFEGKSATIDQKLTLSNGEVWYHYSVNGKYWFYGNSRSFSDVVLTSTTKKLGTPVARTIQAINSAYAYDFGPAGTAKYRRNAALSHFNGKTAYVDQEITLSNGEAWVRYSLDKKYYFFAKAENFKTLPTIKSTTSANLSKSIQADNGEVIYDNAPGGTAKARKNSNLKAFNGKTAKINQVVELSNGEVWYHYSVNNKYWFYALATGFTGTSISDSKNVRLTMQITAVSGDYAYDYKPAGVAGNHKNSALSSYNNKMATVNQQLTLANGETWYHYSLDGKYWFYANARNFIAAHVSAENNYAGMDVSKLSAAQRSFLAQVSNEAITVAAKRGLYPSVIVAQAAIETGWGTSVLAQKANNYFGIKADKNWTGAVFNAKTQEEVDGEMTDTTANFRKYNSLSESVADYGAKIANSSYYTGTFRINAADGIAAAEGLTKWATASKYVTSVQDTIRKYDLNVLDKF